MRNCIELRNLLKKVKPYKTRDEIDGLFIGIADILLNKVYIVKDKKQYRILEIEFYYKSPNYQRKVGPSDPTYRRDAKAGQWFFHSYGMDLCFPSDTSDKGNEYFGGILIRSILEELIDESNKTGNKKAIIGPGSTCDKLFTVFDAFENVGYERDIPRICDREECGNETIKRTFRYHIEDAERTDSYKIKDEEDETLNLRFVVNDFDTYTTTAKKEFSQKERLGHCRKNADTLIKEKKSKK